MMPDWLMIILTPQLVSIVAFFLFKGMIID